MTIPGRGLPGYASGAGLPVPPSQVIITTNGSTFAPTITAPSGAVVTWWWNGGSAQGASPSINFGSSATRQVIMTVTLNGADAMSQVTVFNIGYNYSNDTGNYSPLPAYNKSPQPVAALANINKMTGLVLFLAGEINTLTGPADFTGMSQMTNIECFGSSFTSTVLTGCTSLQRMVFESNNFTSININPALSALREVRMAAQQGGSLTFTPAVSGPLPVDYHWCFRDQTITDMPTLATTLPAVQELWIWNTGQSGTLVTGSTALTNVQAFTNSYTSADFTGGFVTGTGAYLDLHSNSLTTVTLTGCTSLLFADLHDNLLTQGAVDAVLGVLAGTSISNGTVNVGGTGNAAPSSAGLTSAATLTGRGWTVTHN